MGDRARDVYPLPLLPVPVGTAKSPRGRARACRRRRVVERTNVAIAALNKLYCATCTEGGTRAAQGPITAQQSEVIQYIMSCIVAYIETEGPPFSGADKNQDIEEHGYEEGKGAGMGSPAPLKAELLSLPQRGGGFAASDYVGAEMAAFCNADPDIMVEPWLAELLASGLRSGARIDSQEYAEVIKRLLLANMAELSAESSPHPLGMFAVWKEVDRIQRLIIDGRPVNEYFTSPPYEFTSGEDLSRVQVKLGHLLEVAKCDLCDFFHCCEATDALRRYFGLKGIPAALLRKIGIDVPADRVDSRGMTFPRLTTLPMGFGPSPGIAQSAHECVLYGSAGSGSALARQLEPVVRPEARWSGQRVPTVDSPHAATPHALIIDDLLLFRQVPDKSLATGGGVCDHPATMAVLSTNYRMLYLHNDPLVLYDRSVRGGVPAFLDPERPREHFLEIAARRDARYREHADLVVDITGLHPDEALARIMEQVR